MLDKYLSGKFEDLFGVEIAVIVSLHSTEDTFKASIKNQRRKRRDLKAAQEEGVLGKHGHTRHSSLGNSDLRRGSK
jgi:hypothetical protein